MEKMKFVLHTEKILKQYDFLQIAWNTTSEKQFKTHLYYIRTVCSKVNPLHSLTFNFLSCIWEK